MSGIDKDGGLFAAPEPEHPDAVVAREEITRYYNDRAAEAEQRWREAVAELARREAERDAWVERGELTADVVGGTDMTPGMIASASIGRYHAACQPLLAQMQAIGGQVVNRSPDAPQLRAEAERLGEREKALRRWLTAHGHDLGALAEPAPSQGRRTRRGAR